MRNKSFKFEYQITNIKEHEKLWLSDEINYVTVIGKSFEECLNRAKETVKNGWGNR